jgi:hypothetical protein
MKFSEFSTTNERLAYYKQNGFDSDAYTDEDCTIRIAAYRTNGYTRDALTDPNYLIRWEASLFFNEFNINDRSEHYMLKYYQMIGITPELRSSPHYSVRAVASRIYGFLEESKNDTAFDIRQEAFRRWGYDTTAFTDYENSIRHEAYLELGFTYGALYDGCTGIREDASRYFNTNSN